MAGSGSLEAGTPESKGVGYESVSLRLEGAPNNSEPMSLSVSDAAETGTVSTFKQGCREKFRALGQISHVQLESL